MRAVFSRSMNCNLRSIATPEHAQMSYEYESDWSQSLHPLAFLVCRMTPMLIAGQVLISEAAIWYGLRMLERAGGGVRQTIKADNAYERRLLSEVLDSFTAALTAVIEHDRQMLLHAVAVKAAMWFQTGSEVDRRRTCVDYLQLCKLETMNVLNNCKDCSCLHRM